VEPDRAIEIVQSLADGVDPYSGERFPSSSPYQQADTVRALHLALEGLAKLKRSTARKTGPGRPWIEDEEKELLRQFDDKIDLSACDAQAGVEEIAKEHERTKGAIWARLEKLGRIQRKDFPGSTPHPPRSGAAPEPTPPTGNLPPPDPDGNDDYPF
jgi:hypothetical protein